MDLPLELRDGDPTAVTYARNALPLLGAPLTVRCCSAFDSPTAITCGRRCVSAEYRLPWRRRSSASRGHEPVGIAIGS